MASPSDPASVPGEPGRERLRLSSLPTTAPTRFALEPGPEGRAALAEELGLLKLPKLRFTGALHPEGRRDWRLEADLGATVVQPCAVTLAPVTTRIDTPVERRYVAGYALPEAGSEAEMPEDDTTEPLPETLDLAAVMAEALALALPDYPRAEGAEFGEVRAAPPGAEPLTDAETKPFAALAALRDKLSDKE